MNSQDKDLVTIVVPTYNAESFLKENIESILGQTYKNLEVIYVCDGCTDCTVDILTEYEGDGRLKIRIESENHGAAISRNIGMDMAHGDWIIFLDADDLVELNMIEEMVRCAVEANADMCCCYWEKFENVPNRNAHVCNEMGKLLCDTYPIIETEKELGHIMQLMDNAACTKLVHKSIYKKGSVYFQDIPNANDVYYSMIAAMESKRIVYIDKVFWHYRNDKGRQTLSTTRNTKKSYIWEACDKIYKYILKKENSICLLQSFYNFVLFNIYVYLEEGIYAYIFETLRNKYFLKWQLDNCNITDGLNCVNRVIYYHVLENEKNVSRENIYIEAKLELVRSLSETGCSIWGTGVRGSDLLNRLSKTDVKIQHVFDSSKDKWGKEMYGYHIENFYETKADNIIITTPQYCDEIRKQIGRRAEHVYNVEQQIWIIPCRRKYNEQ